MSFNNEILASDDLKLLTLKIKKMSSSISSSSGKEKVLKIIKERDSE